MTVQGINAATVAIPLYYVTSAHWIGDPSAPEHYARGSTVINADRITLVKREMISTVEELAWNRGIQIVRNMLVTVYVIVKKRWKKIRLRVCVGIGSAGVLRGRDIDAR